MSRFDPFSPAELAALQDALLKTMGSDDRLLVEITDAVASRLTARLERWSVEVLHRGSYPRRSFWLDVTGHDSTSAVEVARAVLSELWQVNPDAYEFRPCKSQCRI